jgi:hypothetical protein
MGNKSSTDTDREMTRNGSSKKTNTKFSKFTEEEKHLGTELEKLCTSSNLLSERKPSICKIFKVNLKGRDVAVKQIPHVEGSGTVFDYMTREWELQKQLDQENKNILKLEAIGCTADYK